MSSKVEFRRIDPLDFNSYMGMFVKEGVHVRVEQDEQILMVPKSCMISGKPAPTSAAHNPDGYMECDTVHTLLRELRLGADKSNYGPYIDYLLEQPHGQLPSSYSDAGKKLLDAVLGDKDDDDLDEHLLPPIQGYDWSDEWESVCNGSNHDAFELQAALLVIQRSWDTVLVPILDMINHGNGRLQNVNATSVHGNPLTVKALRPIEAGQEIIHSYTLCEDCGSVYPLEGTPAVYRDFGFVERCPRRFQLIDEKLLFDLDEDDDNDGELILTWLSPKANEQDLVWLDHQLDRLESISEQVYASNNDDGDNDDDIPQHERYMIQQYYEALTVAIHAVLQDSQHQLKNDEL